MFSFENDYSEGACKQILTNLVNTNYVQTSGYGVDQYCDGAAKLIKKAIKHDDVDVHFIPGGTPCNTLAACLLRPHEALICVESGHINVHETGSVEATGHKILTVKGSNGKITPKDIETVIKSHTDEHQVKPKMVFISNATELGTIYYKEELKAISKTCKKYGLYLYMDGARLANALTATKNDLTLKDICELTDLFYIGGTKNGALYGEAMIIRRPEFKEDFRYIMKQRLAMMAKSRIMGIEFITLFEKNLYLKLAKNANVMAQALKKIFIKYGIKMYIDSPTNQIFPIIDNDLLEKIMDKYKVTIWSKYNEYQTVVRFVCSWNTKQSDIENFYNDFKEYTKQK